MFKKAIPVFAKNRENELNCHLILRGETDSLSGAVIRITAFSFYRLTVNGSFVSFGPARAAEGYGRVDEIALDAYDRDGTNEIVIEVTGYNCSSLSTVRQSSFIVAELCRGEEILLCTGRDFEGYISAHRLRRVERFSVQRHFGEVFDLTEAEPYAEKYRVELTPARNRPVYLQRHAPMPTYELITADGYVSAGRFEYDASLPFRATAFSFPITPEWGCFEESEIPYKPYRWLQQQRQIKERDVGSLPAAVSVGEYLIVDMKRIETGFLCFEAEAKEASDVVIGFCEYCSPDRFEFNKVNMQCVIEYIIPKEREVKLQSFEPYTCRFAIIAVRSGAVTVRSFGVRRFEFDRRRLIPREIKDGELAEIYRAAEATFVHNAVDLYSDCPSRERAGWLCDSFFTGRAEYFLTGRSDVEDAFLENYRLYKYNRDFPKGVLPMCYPSDAHDNNKFIPQWDMWYVLEVAEYLTERRPDVDKELFRESVMGIVSFLEGYENGDGLLERLPSWNFVEWSTANKWVQDVNYPTNFLYAETLRKAGELYGSAALCEKAERVAARTAELSFDGETFTDNARRDAGGRLVNTKNVSEAGQYYAILFGNFDLNDKKYAGLHSLVMSGFEGFEREDGEFVPVNAFIGFYLRICALMKLGESERLCGDIKRFFGGMSKETGTLWEYKEGKGSRDHGFASYAAVAIEYIENQK